MASQFDGVYCPSITPRTSTGEIDFDAWGLHLDALVEAGITGILLFGSIGEFYAYTPAQKIEAFEFAHERVGSATQLLFGVSSTNMEETKELIAAANRIGASAILALSPYYFGPSDDAAVAYFARLSELSRVPIILYNFPARTGNDLSGELVKRICDAAPRVQGIKDTVDCASHTRHIIECVRPSYPEFAVFSGFDEYYVTNRIEGGNGVLCGLTNVVPSLFVEMNEAWLAHDMNTVIACAQKISKLMEVYGMADLFVLAIKEAVAMNVNDLEVCIAEPQICLTDEQKTRIHELVESARM